jgi:CheY-like chemotaxis protein
MSSAEESPSMTTILVVDDEFLIADILSVTLEDAGYRVFQASNGKKALEVLARETPSLIITDFMMPLMNGLELAQQIKSKAETADIPIILMTGAQAHIAQQNSTLFTQILGKPFNIIKLIDTVKTIIGAAQG